MNLRGDRYPRENILIHEFAHAMHEEGLNSIDRRFDARLRECFDQADLDCRAAGRIAETGRRHANAEERRRRGVRVDVPDG